jgi:hypothetical protein
MATPPVFTAGQVLTAAQMNKIGLWLVKSETIGTSVSSVVVADAFTSDFANYRIVVSGGTITASAALYLQLGSTTTGYYYTIWGFAYAGTQISAAGVNQANFYIGASVADGHSAIIDIAQPQLAKRTYYSGNYVSMLTTGATSGTLTVGGYLNNSTQYTGFTMSTSTGLMTGGKIDVYGYRQ